MKSIKSKIKQSSVKKKLSAGGTVSMTDDQKVEMWYDNVDESELDRILREFGWKPYKFKVTILDLDNEPGAVYPPWDKLGETYLEGSGDKLKSQLTEYIIGRHPGIKKMSDPYEILNELFHHESTIDDIIPGHIQLKSGGRVPKIQIENFIARYNLWGKDARVRFKDDTKRYFTKNIHPDRKHIFVYEENKLGDRQIRNKRIEDIVSVNERPASVYLMENGGNVKKYLLGGEIGTPEWTEQIIKDADSFFALTNTEPVGEDYVKYIQDTLKRTCTANLKTAENYYKKWLLTKESSMRNGGRFKLDAKLKNGGNNDDFAGSNKSRKFIPNKITKDELQSIISGKSKISDGDTIQAALAYIRREEGSNSINRGAKPDVEKERLIEFIGINNLWYKGELNPDYSLGRGGEHIVYEDPNDENFILKTNNLSLYGSWSDYLINLLLNNTFFPDTSYKLIGFKNEQGNILPVVRQHFVAQATIASLKDVQAYLFNRGFQKVHPLVNAYRNWDLGIVIGDLHDRNVLLKDGVLFFIDTKFFISHNVDYVYNNGGKTGYFSSSEKNINYNKNIKNEIRNVLSGASEVSNGAAIQAAASYIRRNAGASQMAERGFDNKREEVKDYEMKDGGKTESLIGKTISLSYILDHKYKKRGLEPDVLIDKETAKAVHLKKEQDPKAKTRDTKIDKWYPKSWLKTVKSTGGLYLEVPFWAAENGADMTGWDSMPKLHLGEVIPLKSVTIVDSEGKSDYTGKFPMNFPDFLSASKYIRENFKITPGMGYYKHTIKAEWNDGETWEERIDIGDRENNPNVYENIFGAYILDTTIYYIAIAERDGGLSYMEKTEIKERAKKYVELIKEYDFQIQKSDWHTVLAKKEKDFSGSWARNFHIAPYAKDELYDVIVTWLGEDFINHIGKSSMQDGGTLGLEGATHLPYEISVYVPSTKDVDKPVTKSEMDERTSSVTKYLADKFGGFTSMNTTGGYFDHQNKLVKEPVVKITSFSTEKDFTANKENLIKQIQDWSHQWGQEAIGLEFEGDLYYVSSTTKSDGGRTTSYIKAPMLENYFITGPNPSFYQGRIWKANLDMITIERILAPHRFKEFKKNYYLDLMKSEAKQIIDLKMNAKTTLN